MKYWILSIFCTTDVVWFDFLFDSTLEILWLSCSCPNSNTTKVVQTFKVSISWFNYIRLLPLFFESKTQ